MNDPDDLYYCTYGELVEGQKYRFYTTTRWSKAGFGLAWNADRVVQAQRWVEPPPPPVTVEIEADVLADALTAWSIFGYRHDFAADQKMFVRHREALWAAIRDARKKAES